MEGGGEGAGIGKEKGEGGTMWLRYSKGRGGALEVATENHRALNECDKGAADFDLNGLRFSFEGVVFAYDDIDSVTCGF